MSLAALATHLSVVDAHKHRLAMQRHSNEVDVRDLLDEVSSRLPDAAALTARTLLGRHSACAALRSTALRRRPLHGIHTLLGINI